jgi:hypothetical protein
MDNVQKHNICTNYLVPLRAICYCFRFLTLRSREASSTFLTEQAVLSGHASDLYFGRCLVLTPARTPIIVTEIFHVFSQPLLANTEILPLSGYDHFLPQPFRIIIGHHQTIRRNIFWATSSVVKWRTTQTTLCGIWRSPSGNYNVFCCLRYDVVWTGRISTMFRRNVLPLSSGKKKW